MDRTIWTGLLMLVAAAGVRAEPAAPLTSLARMPVREVTVFKDGHAYVVHQGSMPTDKAGNVLLDQLPSPVLGTFWPHSTDKRASLQGVTAGRKRLRVERTAMSVRELIEANAGAEVVVTESGKPSYQATIVRVLSRPSEEMEATMPSGASEVLPVRGNIVLLKTIEGTKAVSMDQLTDVKFSGKYETKIADEEFRPLLTMQLDWGGQAPAANAEVGMAYVQKGFRWIPNYRIELDGKGKAVVKLQATLLNELTDLKDATVNLVVGVPAFYFKETTDPIALSQAIAQLSPYFQTDASTQYALSNSMMTQVARGGEVHGPRPSPKGPGAGPADLGPEPPKGTQNEDFFVHTLRNVTLARGQRMVVPVSTFTIEYKDLYTLDIPYGIPSEFKRQNNNAQAAELARLMGSPKVMHKLRLINGNQQPLTTAPALLLRDGKVISQSMITFASKGGIVELTMATAIDVKVRRVEKETKRTPNAESYLGQSYSRTDLDSVLEITNQTGKPIEVEVTRFVLGSVDKSGPGTKAEKINVLEEDDGPVPSHRPDWWSHYSWPAYWTHLNPVSRVTWTSKLPPGQSHEQSYSWHYYWQ